MNWLAHLRLSPGTGLLRLGNLAGDFVRGVDVTALHPELRAGIAQHRAVDRFVDAHPATRAARARLGAPWRRWSGVLVDVFFDHYLARDWHRFGDGGPLPAFLAGVAAELQQHDRWLPAGLRAVAPRFAADGWLAGYATVDGIERVLGLMARRVARPTPLAAGGEALRAHYEPLAGDFAALWPELAAFAAEPG